MTRSALALLVLLAPLSCAESRRLAPIRWTPYDPPNAQQAAHRHAIVVHLDELALAVNGDPGRARAIVVHWLENALYVRHRDGRIIGVRGYYLPGLGEVHVIADHDGTLPAMAHEQRHDMLSDGREADYWHVDPLWQEVDDAGAAAIARLLAERSPP